MALEVPITTQIELKREKLDQETLKQVSELNSNLNESLLKVGQISMRTKELHAELVRLETLADEAEEEYKQANKQLNNFAEKLEKRFPKMRLDLSTGEVIYQPNAEPTQSPNLNI